MANLAAMKGNSGPGEIYKVQLGGPTTTDQIVWVWRHADLYVNKDITQDNFPVTHHAIEDVEIEVADPACSFSEKDGLKFLEAADLERPTAEHALRFAEQCGHELRFTGQRGKKPLIVFLHKPWRDQVGDRRIVCVERGPGGREINLVSPDGEFLDHCVLAGVRRLK